MPASSTMVVALQDLPLTRLVELRNEFVGTTLAEMPARAILERPEDDPAAGSARAEVELHGNEDDHVFLRGCLSGWFTVACSRCVEPVKVAFEETLAVTFLPRSKLPPEALEPEGDRQPGGAFDADLGWELDDEDLDLYGYEGQSIDLEPLLREQLILAVPFAPLCSPDCKGLCPQCGVDRNQTQCACQPPIDPRLAALEEIDL